MNTRYLIKILIPFILAISFSELSAQCLLPVDDNFDELYSELLERKDWKKKMERNTTRLENFRYKNEIDSLFHFAMAYFEERLPEEKRCTQVDVTDSAWLSFHNSKISMRFAYYLSDKNAGKYDERITVNFNYQIKEKKINSYHEPNNLWVPNCIIYPDSCKFEITSIKQCEEIAKEVGFIQKDENFRTYSGKNIPFHYDITKPIDDDCGTQTLYVNMYTSDTILSSRNIAFGCQTWENKIDGSSIVIDGTVVNEEGFSIDGSIYTKAKIEIHHLFKGKTKGNFIYTVVQGGELGNSISTLSHGQINLGKKKDRNIYFLSRDLMYKEKIFPIEKLLGHEIYFANYYPYPMRDRHARSESIRKSYEEQFRRMEKIIGKKREPKLHPGNWEVEENLTRRKNFPDRQKGIDLLIQEDYRETLKDSIRLYFGMASTNEILYLKEWELNLTYDTLALGSWLFNKHKIAILDNHWAFKNLNKYYELKVTDKNENTINFKWSTRDTSKLFFEFFPAQDQRPKLQFISAIKIVAIDDTKPMNLQLELAGKTLGYNHSSNEDYLIESSKKSNLIIHSLSHYKTPIIKSFSPQKVGIGDTITITGKYLENTKPMLFGVSLSSEEKFLELKKENIVSQTDSKIVFTLPSFLSDKYRVKPINLGNETFKPTTNIIRLSKRTAYKGASSEEKLIIN